MACPVALEFSFCGCAEGPQLAAEIVYAIDGEEVRDKVSAVGCDAEVNEAR